MEKVFWKVFNEKLSVDSWLHIDYHILQSYLRNNNQVLIVDVSAEDNHKLFLNKLITYKNIPLKDLIIRKSELENYKEWIIICICAGGPKSSVAAMILRFDGYDSSFIVGGTEALALQAPIH